MKKNVNFKPAIMIAMVGICALITGVTYSIFNTETESTKQQVIQTGAVSLVLDENEGLTLNSLLSMSDAEGLSQETYYDITLENVGDDKTKYKLFLLDDADRIVTFEGSLLSDQYVKVGVEVDGEEVGPVSLKEANRLLYEGMIDKGQLITYRLRFWLDFSDLTNDQISDLEGHTLLLKFYVSGEQYLQTADACFSFENGTIKNYYANEGNVATGTKCPTDVIVPETIGNVKVTAIGDSAFAGANLSSIVLPYGLTTIGTNSFSRNSLAEVRIPANVTSIGNMAFLATTTSNSSLVKIINTTGRSFNWNKILNESSTSTATSIGGTFTTTAGTIEVASE